jgi:hypothetical protein
MDGLDLDNGLIFTQAVYFVLKVLLTALFSVAL